MPASTDVLSASALELTGRIKAGELSSREVVSAHIDHIEEVNPVINAVVADRFEAALQEADAADRQRQNGAQLGPLHGVPFTVKESFWLSGMPNSAGLMARKDVVATEDAVVVRALRDAGGIPIGVTNVSELCMWMETFNRVYGRTNNPYDPTRIVGGSSGGEGAIVGAGGSPFGVGADIGGSIRMPAFFNGVFGHKPTGACIPNAGQYPISENQALRYLSTGPIARAGRDLPLLVKLMWHAPDPAGHTPAHVLRDPEDVDVSALDVLVVEGDGFIPVARELKIAQRGAAEHLQSVGANVRETSFKKLRSAWEIWAAMLQEAQESSYEDLLGEGEPVRALTELVGIIRGTSPYTLPSLGLCVLEKVTGSMTERATKMVAMGQELKRELVEALGDNGVMLYPPYPLVAPRHDVPILLPIMWAYTAVMNVMELPVTQVPLGLNADGLPLGVQVVAAHGHDHLTLAVALELERAFDGWIPPWQS